MATTRPFAYNLGSSIDGTEQLGNLAIGTPTSGFTQSPKFWNGPDEDLGYVIAHQTPSGQPGADGTTAFLGFWRTQSKTEESFIELAEYVSNGTQTFNSGSDAKSWLNTNGYWTSYISTPVSPTPTPTQTPTNTPTPSTSPIPLTGYPFNLVALPYNFPSSGNSIMNGPGGSTSGSTNVNELNVTSRGFYFNSIDANSVDRTNYYSAFTGQSVTITLSQGSNTAIYSGDTNSFKQWIQAPEGSGFVFGTGVGVPPSGTPSGIATLIQSATTAFTIGVPVYVSLVINPGVTPTPTPTSTTTPTNTPSQTPTLSVTPTQTPSNTATLTPTPTTSFSVTGGTGTAVAFTSGTYFNAFTSASGVTTTDAFNTNSGAWQLYYSHSAVTINSGSNRIGLNTYNSGSNSWTWYVAISNSSNTIGNWGTVSAITSSQSFSYAAGGFNQSNITQTVTIPANRYFLIANNGGPFFRTIKTLASNRTAQIGGTNYITVCNKVALGNNIGGGTTTVPVQFGGSGTGYQFYSGASHVHSVIFG